MFNDREDALTFLKECDEQMERMSPGSSKAIIDDGDRVVLGLVGQEEPAPILNQKLAILRAFRDAVRELYKIVPNAETGEYQEQLVQRITPDEAITVERVREKVLKNCKVDNTKLLEAVLGTHQSTGFWKKIQEFFGIKPKSHSFVAETGLFKVAPQVKVAPQLEEAENDQRDEILPEK